MTQGQDISLCVCAEGVVVSVLSIIKHEVCFRRSKQSVWATVALQQAPYVALYILWCEADDPQSGLKIQNFGHALQFGAAVASMVVIETRDGNSCCLLLQQGFKLEQMSAIVPRDTFIYCPESYFLALKHLMWAFNTGYSYLATEELRIYCPAKLICQMFHTWKNRASNLGAAVIYLCQN